MVMVVVPEMYGDYGGLWRWLWSMVVMVEVGGVGDGVWWLWVEAVVE